MKWDDSMEEGYWWACWNESYIKKHPWLKPEDMKPFIVQVSKVTGDSWIMMCGCDEPIEGDVSLLRKIPPY